MKILALPRDPNPFQEQLYAPMRAAGNAVRYLDGPTRSAALNLLLLPVQLVLHRAAGYTVLHIHWLFGFVPAWATARPLRAIFRLWYMLTLGVAQLIGLRIVWTAHNVVPHAPIFDDDLAARRFLVLRSAAVVAMNSAVARAVRERFRPRCPVEVIPHGSYVDVFPALPPPAPKGDDGGDCPCRVVFFGRVEPYKGVVELLEAVAALPPLPRWSVTVAGECADPVLLRELVVLAAWSPHPVRLQLDRVPDAAVAPLLAEADLVAFPFRQVSTSGSVMLAMGLGAYCVVPRLPAFADVPNGALHRYDGDVGAALVAAAARTPDERDAVRREARAFAGTLRWDEIARRYLDVFASTGSTR